jgi:hypothetical protein
LLTVVALLLALGLLAPVNASMPERPCHADALAAPTGHLAAVVSLASSIDQGPAPAEHGLLCTLSCWLACTPGLWTAMGVPITAARIHHQMPGRLRRPAVPWRSRLLRPPRRRRH